VSLFDLVIVNKGRTGIIGARGNPPVILARVTFVPNTLAIQSMEVDRSSDGKSSWVEIRRLTDEELLSMIRRVGELIGETYSEPARILLDYLNEELGRRV
jgi:hypothetical protein